MLLTTFTSSYNLLLSKFAEKCYLKVHNWVNGFPEKPLTNNDRMLFLYCYALSTWEQDAIGNSAQHTNYLTEKQVSAIISRAKEL